MKRRLSLITEIIAPYRIPVFNALAARDDLDLHVIFLSETDPSLRQWQVYKSEIRFSYQVLPAFRKRFGKYNVLLNRGLADALAQACPDAILCGGYNYLASWQAQRWATKRAIPFLLWLESTAADQRRRTRLVEALKRRLLEHCSAFVVPGKASEAYASLDFRTLRFQMTDQRDGAPPGTVTRFFAWVVMADSPGLASDAHSDGMRGRTGRRSCGTGRTVQHGQSRARCHSRSTVFWRCGRKACPVHLERREPRPLRKRNSSRRTHHYALFRAAGMLSLMPIPAAAQQAFEQQIGNALNVRYKVWRAL